MEGGKAPVHGRTAGGPCAADFGLVLEAAGAGAGSGCCLGWSRVTPCSDDLLCPAEPECLSLCCATDRFSDTWYLIVFVSEPC